MEKKEASVFFMPCLPIAIGERRETFFTRLQEISAGITTERKRRFLWELYRILLPAIGQVRLERGIPPVFRSSPGEKQEMGRRTGIPELQ